jgi:hypothetical protein
VRRCERMGVADVVGDEPHIPSLERFISTSPFQLWAKVSARQHSEETGIPTKTALCLVLSDLKLSGLYYKSIPTYPANLSKLRSRLLCYLVLTYFQSHTKSKHGLFSTRKTTGYRPGSSRTSERKEGNTSRSRDRMSISPRLNLNQYQKGMSSDLDSKIGRRWSHLRFTSSNTRSKSILQRRPHGKAETPLLHSLHVLDGCRR